MSKRFYICHVTLRTPALPGLTNFVTPVIALGDDDASRQAVEQWHLSFPDHPAEVLNVSGNTVKNEVIEQAAVEILGWKRPSEAE